MRSKPLSDILYRFGQPLRVNMPVLVERGRFEGNGPEYIGFIAEKKLLKSMLPSPGIGIGRRQ